MASNAAFSPAILIPVYNHEAAIKHTLNAVLQYEWPVLLVDDGSKISCQLVLTTLREQHADRVALLRLERNSGKGAAVKAGIKWLHTKGYSHAIQVDADGQHDLADLPTLVALAELHPLVLVTGYPTYDDSIPLVRYYSRYLTHIWIWINTLSFQVRDSMCGFRAYPLAQTTPLLEREKCGDRMDFDMEILVRWLWSRGKIKDFPTKVTYPLDGISHFNIWQDNLLISWMHCRLFFGMLRRSPAIIWRKLYG
ncbi:MAG: glycosyl transferase [Methylophaga sp.]|nr:MAG: glycosyl transferase [Methylophaga sp.]